MTKKIFQRITAKTFSIKFSILTIFVILFTVSMSIIIGIMYISANNNINNFAFDMMKQVSLEAYNKLNSNLTNIKIKNQAVAKLFIDKVISLDLSKNDSIVKYNQSVLINEAKIFPILQAIMWVDRNGNMVNSKIMGDDIIRTEIIYKESNDQVHEYRFLSIKNNQSSIINLPPSDYDASKRFWWIQTYQNKKTTWTDVYSSWFTHLLIISVVSPVINEADEFIGMVSFDVRLDFLQRLVESFKFSQNGVVFILTNKGKLVAYPNIEQYKNNELMNIYQLTQAPWVVSSYKHYLRYHKNQFSFYYNGSKYLVNYKSLKELGDGSWIIGVVVPEDDFVSVLHKSARYSIAFALIILLLSLLGISAIISRLIKPMKKITAEIDKIKSFEISETPKILSRIKEVSYMASALYSMKQGLRSFQKYIPASLVRTLIEAGEEAKIGGNKKELVVFFSDIHDFTTIAEKCDPNILASKICDYFDVLTSVITNEKGTIDKYIGDCIMAFWGAPLDVDQPCHKAAKAALLCLETLKGLNNRWKNEDQPEFLTSIGLHYGETTVGNFGSSERLSYTALGDTVNLASRLEHVNRYFGTNIIVSENVYQIIKDQFVLRMIDCVSVKGKEESVNIYELVGDDVLKVSFDINQYNIFFAKGFAYYKNQEWDNAIKYFNKCIDLYEVDNVGKLFVSRCENYKISPPPKNWHGVWHLN